jgi:hypothetical protein
MNTSFTHYNTLREILYDISSVDIWETLCMLHIKRVKNCPNYLGVITHKDSMLLTPITMKLELFYKLLTCEIKR